MYKAQICATCVVDNSKMMVLNESSRSKATQSKAEIVTYQVPGASYTTTSRGLPRSKQKKD